MSQFGRMYRVMLIEASLMAFGKVSLKHGSSSKPSQRKAAQGLNVPGRQEPLKLKFVKLLDLKQVKK